MARAINPHSPATPKVEINNALSSARIQRSIAYVESGSSSPATPPITSAAQAGMNGSDAATATMPATAPRAANIGSGSPDTNQPYSVATTSPAIAALTKFNST